MGNRLSTVSDPEEIEERRIQRNANWDLFKQRVIAELQNKTREIAGGREESPRGRKEKRSDTKKYKESLKKEIADRRERVNQYRPGSSMEFSEIDFPEILNVGLFGTTGIGKTSLLNSLKYAVKGELRELNREQVAPADYQGGHTLRRQAVRLTKHIAFIDNRGVAAEDLGTAGNTEEVIRQLEGRSTFVNPIEWSGGAASNKLNDKEKRDRERIYCAVLVFDARKAKAYFEVASKFVTCLHDWQGRFPIAVVTNIDIATQEDLDNMRLVLGTTGIIDVYEVANILPNEDHLEERFQLTLLKMIEKCVGDGDRIYELRNRIEAEEESEDKWHTSKSVKEKKEFWEKK